MITPYSQGNDVCGSVSYLAHDKAPEGEPRPKTSDRLDWTHTENLPTDDVFLAAKIIRGQIQDAPALKKAAGIAPGGRRLEEPIVQFTLCWHPDQNPTPEEMREASLEAASALGLRNRPLMMFAHNDRGHKHVHNVASRIDPETGKALNMHRPKQKLSRWAGDYEIRQGLILVPARLERQAEGARYDPADPVPLPPMQPRRAPGGRPPHTQEETAEWRAISERQREEPANPQQDLAERLALTHEQQTRRITSQRQAERRERRYAAAAAVAEKGRLFGTLLANGASTVGRILASGTNQVGTVIGSTASNTRRVGSALAVGTGRVGTILADGASTVGTALAAGARSTGRAIAAAPGRTVDRIVHLLPDVSRQQDAWNEAYDDATRDVRRRRRHTGDDDRVPETDRRGLPAPRAAASRTTPAKARRSPTQPRAPIESPPLLANSGATKDQDRGRRAQRTD